MRYFAKRDLNKYLPNLLMFAMSLIVLEIFMAVAILTKRNNLAGTALIMFLVVMLLMAILMLGLSGKVFLLNLRDTVFYKEVKSKGFKTETILLSMNGLYAALSILLFAVYVGTIVLDIKWVRHVFPEENEAMGELITKILPPTSNRAEVIWAGVLEYVLIPVSFTALTFFAVTMSYNLFTRGKYCGILAGIFTVIFGYAMVSFIAKFTYEYDAVASHLCSAAIQAIATALFLGISIYSIKKRNWKDEAV